MHHLVSPCVQSLELAHEASKLRVPQHPDRTAHYVRPWKVFPLIPMKVLHEASSGPQVSAKRTQAVAVEAVSWLTIVMFIKCLCSDVGDEIFEMHRPKLKLTDRGLRISGLTLLFHHIGDHRVVMTPVR